MRLFSASRQRNGDSRSTEHGKACQVMIDRLSGGNLIGIYGERLVRPCMANTSVGTKMGAASHPQILYLDVVLFKGGQVKMPVKPKA